MTHLVDLPDELLCEILKYLSSFHALKALMGLNQRLDRLLLPFKQHIDLTHLSHQDFSYYFDVISPIVNDNEPLYAIKLGNKQTPGQIKLFNMLITNDICRRRLSTVHTIVVESPGLEDLTALFNGFLSTLPELMTLSVQVAAIRDEYFLNWTQLIIGSLFSIPSLIKLSIDMPCGLGIARLSSNIIWNSLIDVTVNLSIVTDLLLLIRQIPNVHHLSVRIAWWTSGDRTLVKMLDEMRLTNPNPASLLIHLETFHLTIESVIAFQFDHLEQVLHRTINDQTTFQFAFMLKNGLSRQGELAELLNGQQWEHLLLPFTNLRMFHLYIRLVGNFNDENMNFDSFRTGFFLRKNWLFDCLKNSNRDHITFHSIPYMHKEPIEITTDDLRLSFPQNYARSLIIESNRQFEAQILNSTLLSFGYLRELCFIHFNTTTINESALVPLHFPVVSTLKIEKGDKTNVPILLDFLPLINTLSISYWTVFDQNGLIKFSSIFKSLYQRHRIVRLTLSDIPTFDGDHVLHFLNQLPDLRYLQLGISNRRMPDDYLLANLRNILERFNFLINLNLKLEKNIESSLRWQSDLHRRIQMILIENIFDGILVQFWL